MTRETSIQRPRRWDQPFGPDLERSDVERILAGPVFDKIQSNRFPQHLQLADIVRNDARLVRLSRGDILVREGDYGSSVFVILSGALRVVLDPEVQGELRGRQTRPQGTWLGALWRMVRTPKVAEFRDVSSYRELSLRRTGDPHEARSFVPDVDKFCERHSTALIEQGEIVGEIAALSRSPRTATLFADGDVELVELRWQGLREIRRYDSDFRSSIDALYQSRNLSTHLAETPILQHLDEDTLTIVARHTSFESFGELEWFGAFKEAVSHGASGIVAHEPLIAEEGHQCDGLIIIRSGFARLSRQLDHGHRTVDYLTANETFGLQEIVDYWRTGSRSQPRLKSSLRAVGYVDILRIPIDVVVGHVLPKLPAEMLPETTPGDARTTPAWQGAGASGLEQSLLDALVDTRVINGTATMIIDGNRCVGCDACVSACATTHANNPRFIRHGPSHASLMFTNACMHCVDPVCLIGCPTGAIHRDPVDARVLIDDPTCIGCGTCADSCPYDNIRMVEIRDQRGAFILDADTRAPIVKATKCDLCAGQVGGPACEQACPHDALIRIDMRDRKRLQDWVDRSGRFRRRLATVGAAALAAAGVVAGSWMWDRGIHAAGFFSGWTLLTAIVLLVALAVRKRLPGLPLGRVSAWVRVHAVIGIVAAAAFFAHAGAVPPQGWLELGLWSMFALVAVSGAIGLWLDRILPPRLHKRGEKVLFSRIQGFRRQLASRVQDLATASVRETASATIADYYAHRLHWFFRKPRNLLGHLVESNRGFATLRSEVRHMERYLDEQGRSLLGDIEECIIAKDDLDRQFAIQLVLRAWRFIHLPLTYGLVMLIALHVVLVLAFSAGVP